MVHSPAYGFPLPMCSAAGRTPSGVPVTRFGRPRITATLQLPAAYRSLPRPSSPGGSKASSTDPPLLDHIILPALSLFFQTPMGLTRVELVTSCLSGMRSNQLSYSP